MPESKKLQDVREVSADLKMVYSHTDKDPLEYKVGDDITFICTLCADKTLVSCPKLSWIADTEDGKTYTGSADGSSGELSVTVPATASGIVRLKVFAEDENGERIPSVTQFEDYFNSPLFSVVVNADEVTVKKPEPEDFDKFWAEQAAKVMEVEPDVLSMERVDEPTGVQGIFDTPSVAETHEFYRVRIRTPEECGYAIGYMTVPKNAQSVGITVNFNGYGVRDIVPYICTDHVVFNVCAHAHELGREPSYYEGMLANYGFTGNESRETSYFRTMIMRDIQAVRFIKAYVGAEGVMINGEKKALGIWNGKLRTHGGSQGGFQGIAISALDKDVTDAFWMSPWLCDVAGMRSVYRPPYTDDFRYFDSIYHARRVHENVNVHIISGLGDYVCPPSGVVALYNALKASAKLEFYQGMTHTYNSEIGPLTKYHK